MESGLRGEGKAILPKPETLDLLTRVSGIKGVVVSRLVELAALRAEISTVKTIPRCDSRRSCHPGGGVDLPVTLRVYPSH